MKGRGCRVEYTETLGVAQFAKKKGVVGTKTVFVGAQVDFMAKGGEGQM